MRHVRMLGLSLAAILAMTAVICNAAFAVEGGGPEKLTFKWSKFRHCPAFASPRPSKCFFATTNPEKGSEKKGGFYSVGPITVPVTKPISLQGGLTAELSEETHLQEVIPPNDGAPAIAPAAESVPGAPFENVSETEMNEDGWPQTLRESYKKAKAKHWFKEGKTTEVIEPAGDDVDLASTFNLSIGSGPAIIASVQIAGKNPWLESLGGNCQIGSEANPIVQHLTAGTSVSPLTGEELQGKPGFPEFADEFRIVGLGEAELVDNTYPVPGAEKCGGAENEAFLDPVVNHAFGLPAAAGASKTVLIGQLYQATTIAVINHYF